MLTLRSSYNQEVKVENYQDGRIQDLVSWVDVIKGITLKREGPYIEE